VAVAFLLAGIGRAGVGLIYVSIGASVLAMVFLLAAIVRRPGGRTEQGEPAGPD
jgi:hypothetical protein